MPVNTYCTVADLNDEGFIDPPYTDDHLNRKIRLASTIIENITGMWFGPKSRTIILDGLGGSVLPVFIPIVQVDDIKLLFEASGSTTFQEIDMSTVRVYNRHLTMGMTTPDDRDTPKLELELFTGAGLFLTTWPKGSQNIQITGVFGYTELGPDDPVGETAERSQIPLSQGEIPEDIRDVCIRLVARNLPALSDDEAIEDATRAHQLTAVETRDQKIQWGGGGRSSSSASSSGSTGDPVIDNILSRYMRSPIMRMV